LGDRENIGAEHFPEIFDYIALGHLHRNQTVGKKEGIRYSGAPLPLSFKEYDYQHGCNLITFTKGELKGVEFCPLESPRKLFRFSGSLSSVREQIQKKGEELEKTSPQFPAWIEVKVDLEEFVPNLHQTIQEWVAPFPMEVVMTRISSVASNQFSEEFSEPLNTLSTREIFEKKCQVEQVPEKEAKSLMASFIELESWMKEKIEELV
ncbi:MAG: hypothetical protein HKN16_12760, partial [Saprospiraceae bacterium]|nr:hypothetical protein [Saprospiraceae bacterium]